MGNHKLRKNTEEAELNGKEGTIRGSFQQEITSSGVLIWTSSFLIHMLQDLCLSTGNYKIRSVKLDFLISNTYSARPLYLSTGRNGQPGTHLNGKYQQEMNFIS